ncbi:MAG TPA: helix-turn-helix domain-containing protein [Tahibacter sp.]|uniref:AraC family transcriptional regulator n=1 Tax=Tahibacter sp. TaxID=2056211 RepID=UPI002CBAC178|nr:helix-turn-helix domain-containing protein [Tahibacter sp.]HSX59363.1 helix-turn-helix domain-containing protein [Tahibacter sp.]
MLAVLTVFAVLTVLAVGFSVGSALLLIAAGLGGYGPTGQDATARAHGLVLLASLAALQGAHAAQLLEGTPLFDRPVYVALLFVAAAAFHRFFTAALQPPAPPRWWRALHYAPLALAFVLPGRIAVPLAFAFGTAHALLLLRLVHRLRSQRRHFRVEAAAFAGFAAIAALVLALGLAASWVGERAYVVGYALLIAVGFWLALWLLLRHPDLPGRAADAVRSAYANSTLARVDKDAALARLARLFTEDKVYADENLSLASLAELMELTPHQLSELINTAFGVGFSRHVREHRVAAAQRLLLAEPDASVLSVGLSVGFTSQSNFYAAFREITGEVPGRYRKRAADAGASAAPIA